MAIWGLADLHLSTNVDKPMDIFGEEWANYVSRIKDGWENRVNDSDLVIIPGDISWAMHLRDALDDLKWIGKLPGHKLLLRGNHDYWWESISKIRRSLPPRMYALQNDYFAWEGWAICGSRGWLCPGDTRFDEEKDQKIYLRELQRLELSLKSAFQEGYRNIITALHFPPFNVFREPSGFTELLSSYGVKTCIYGHLHAEAKKTAYEGYLNGVQYIFVAADWLGFCPALLVD